MWLLSTCQSPQCINPLDVDFDTNNKIIVPFEETGAAFKAGDTYRIIFRRAKKVV